MKKPQKTSGLRIAQELDVVSPRALQQEFPITSIARKCVEDGRKSLNAILSGVERRTIIMCGPCSVHSYYEALEYALLLKKLEQVVQDKILIIMRVYFEKPRTTIGWKGLIVDPDLNGKEDLNRGLSLARKTLLSINGIGLPTVTEFLGPIIPRYISDLITTGTIGARTTESQTHREMASGLSMPIGFKNGTDGSVINALNACLTAKVPHSFLGIDMNGQLKVIQTTGNPDGYLVLRGGKNGTNYDKESVEKALHEIKQRNLGVRIVVDCSHENSGKKHVNQKIAFHSVLEQITSGESRLAGMMLESNLLPGRQDIHPNTPLQHGVSVTDECMGWDETESLILDAHSRLY